MRNLNNSKRLMAILFIFLVAQVGLASAIIVSRTRSSTTAKTSSCTKSVGSQTITITPSGFNPTHLAVKVCTEVIFLNLDAKDHWPAFGEHDHHDDPIGFSEKNLKYNATNSYLAKTPGSLTFHDHIDDFTGTLDVVAP